MPLLLKSLPRPVAVLAGIWLALAGGLQTASAAPNIVVILSDDQDMTSMAYMPRTLDKLAAHGTSFTNHLVSNPICGPSRATLLTGQYAHNHKVLTNTEPYGGYSKLDATNTLPVWLQAAGYYTQHIGKYVNDDVKSSNSVPQGWNDFQYFGTKYYNYGVTRNGVTTTYGDAPEDYQTDVLRSRVLAAIRERAGATGPFYMTIMPFAPHDDLQTTTFPIPAPRHIGLFASQASPRQPSYNEADVSDKPNRIRSQPLINAAGEETVTERYRATLETLQAVDELVEAVINTLEEQNLLDDTVVLFSSDNGHFFGEHRIPTGKHKLYKESTRVPLIVRGGGFPAGMSSNLPVSNVDLAATIVRLAGATPGLALDGLSLKAVLNDPLAASRAVLLENWENHGPSTAAIQTERYFYALWPSGETELYDLSVDPGQLNSLHTDPAFATVKSALDKKLTRMKTCKGTTCAVRF